MRRAVRNSISRAACWLILPVVDVVTSILNHARVWRKWGTMPEGSSIAADANCCDRTAVTVEGAVYVGRGASLDAAVGGRIVLGKHVHVGRDVEIKADGGSVSVGQSTYIGWDAFIWAGKRGAVIGCNVLIAPRAAILAANHGLEQIDTPIMSQPLTSRGVVIEDDVWIGSNACVLDGVRVGTGSVVAAGAVVTKDVPPFSVVAGCPARVIKSRGQFKVLRPPHADTQIEDLNVSSMVDRVVAG